MGASASAAGWAVPAEEAALVAFVRACGCKLRLNQEVIGTALVYLLKFCAVHTCVLWGAC